MDNREIFKTVEKIRSECRTKSQDQQIAEHRGFFDDFPAIFLMARDPSMNLETFRIMLDLKNEIDQGRADRENVDKMVGKMFYDRYVNITE